MSGVGPPSSASEPDFLVVAKFQLAQNYVRNGPPIPNLSAFDRMRLHALFKQATEGPLAVRGEPRPPVTDPQARNRWDAWNSLGTMSATEAMTHYVAMVVALVPDCLSWPGNRWLATSLAQQARILGETCQSQQDLLGAVFYFSACILLDPDNYIHLKQRADALLGLQDFERALEDTERVVRAKPTWAKGHELRGRALLGLGRLHAAAAAFREGLQHDEDDADLREALAETERLLREGPVGATASGGGGGGGGGVGGTGLILRARSPPPVAPPSPMHPSPRVMTLSPRPSASVSPSAPLDVAALSGTATTAAAATATAAAAPAPPATAVATASAAGADAQAGPSVAPPAAAASAPASAAHPHAAPGAPAAGSSSAGAGSHHGRHVSFSEPEAQVVQVPPAYRAPDSLDSLYSTLRPLPAAQGSIHTRIRRAVSWTVLLALASALCWLLMRRRPLLLRWLRRALPQRLFVLLPAA